MESLEERRRSRPWMISLHGGHSGEFCDHAEGTLNEILKAAIDAGYHSFGVSEHVPRSEERFLYPNEQARGWTVEKLADDFNAYAVEVNRLAEELGGRLDVLRGFEAEVVPASTYADRMRAYRERRLPSGEPMFDYFVGSVHYVNEIQIDGEIEEWIEACETAGGPERFAVAYYEQVASMIEKIGPDVVGHLDLVKRNVNRAGIEPSALITPATIRAAEGALEAARDHGAILDLNTAGWRKGLGEPYPAPWLVERANRIGVPFCFGDDSHRAAQVAEGVERGRSYLLECGVNTITGIGRDGVRRLYSLAL